MEDHVDGEQVIGYIPVARMKTGLFSSKAYSVVFTSRRIILAELTNAIVTAAVNEARAEAKAEGKGFFGQWGAQIKAGFTVAERYLAMDPDAIAAETPGNESIALAEVRKLEIDREEKEKNEIEQHYLRIRIQTPTRKLQLDTDSEMPSRDEARAIADRALGAVHA
jgi:hypothetical protein